MSYNTDLQNNNTSLQEILATINNLPEAGGSSGGPSSETVSFTVNNPGSSYYQIMYLDSNNISQCELTTSAKTFQIVSSSFVAIQILYSGAFAFEAPSGDCEVIISGSQMYWLKINGNTTLNIFNHMGGAGN